MLIAMAIIAVTSSIVAMDIKESLRILSKPRN